VTPKAIDRRETLLTQHLLVPSGGDRHQHAFERQPLAVYLALGITVLLFDSEEEIDKRLIEFGGGA